MHRRSGARGDGGEGEDAVHDQDSPPEQECGEHRQHAEVGGAGDLGDPELRETSGEQAEVGERDERHRVHGPG